MIIKTTKIVLVTVGIVFGFIAFGAAQLGLDYSVVQVGATSVFCFVVAYILNAIPVVDPGNPSGSAVMALKQFDKKFPQKQKGSFFQRIGEEEDIS